MSQTWDEPRPNHDAFLKAIQADGTEVNLGRVRNVKITPSAHQKRMNEIGVIDVMDSMVNSELARLERESHCDLDAIANDYPYFIGGFE